jgi:hypothetical protein
MRRDEAPRQEFVDQRPTSSLMGWLVDQHGRSGGRGGSGLLVDEGLAAYLS